MIEVALYGKPSSRYEYLKLLLRQKVDEANLEISIKEINDVQSFIRDKVRSIPAIRIKNNRLLQCGQNDDISEFSNRVIRQILKNNNKPRKVLVPVDFSTSSLNAVDYAIALAKVCSSQVELVHAYHPTPVQVNGTVWIDPEAEKNYRDQFKSTLESIREKHPDLVITDQFIYGFPVDELIELSKKDDTKFIVMGSTGENNSIRDLFGTVSQEVSQKAHCPVFVVPGNAKFGLKKVLYATDNPVLDAAGLRVVNRLAGLTKASIHIVHINANGDGSLEEKWLKEIPTVFPELKDFSVGESQNPSVVEGLLTEAKSTNADLIAVATTHRSFWSSIFHKSTTKELLKSLRDQPIMIFHEGDH